MKTHELKNTVRCNHNYTYKVSLECKEGGDWVIHINDAPGCWYLKTLLGKDRFSKTPTGDFIWLDYGQNWGATGMSAVIAEAVDYLGCE